MSKRQFRSGPEYRGRGQEYLKYLQNLYKDDRLALAAYVMRDPASAVDRFKQVPPYPETQKYVDDVGKKYSEARSAAAQGALAQTAAPVSWAKASSMAR